VLHETIQAAAMRKMIRFFIVLIVLQLSFFGYADSLSAHRQETPNVLRVGIFPYKSPRSILSTFAPIAVKLEQKLGMKVQIVTAPDAATYMLRAKAGEYDLALPCVACFFDIQSAGYRIIAMGSPPFHGGVIVRQDSDLALGRQFKGRKVAAVGSHSYAGYLFFREQLTDISLDPDKDVDFHFLGKLETIIFGVINKEYDAGVIRLDSLESPTFAEVKKSLRVVARSVAVPQFPFVVNNNLSDAVVAGIREVLTSLSADQDEDREILESLQIKKIVPAENGDFEEIRKHIEKVGSIAY